MASTLNLTQNVFLSASTYTTATTANVTYIVVGTDTVDRRIYSIGVSSSDNAVNNISFIVNDGTTDFVACRLPISISAGTNTTTAVYDVHGSSLMVGLVKERDSNGASFFHLPKTHSLKVQYQTALTTTEYLNVFVSGHKY